MEEYDFEKHWEYFQSGGNKTFTKKSFPYIFDAVVAHGDRLNRKMRVVDIGCGCGFLTGKIKEINPEKIEVVGIDHSPVAVEFAKSKVSGADFIETDLENFDRDFDGKFDVAVANMVLHNVPCIDNFLRSGANILDDGGIFVSNTLDPVNWLMNKHNRTAESGECVELPYTMHNHEMQDKKFKYFHHTVGDYSVAFENAGLSMKDYYRHDTATEREFIDNALICFRDSATVPPAVCEYYKQWVRDYAGRRKILSMTHEKRADSEIHHERIFTPIEICCK